MNKSGRELIAHMKEIKAQAEQRIHAEIERLFLDRLEKPNKTDQEQMDLFNAIEKMQAQLLEQEIKNNPALASCFYKASCDEVKIDKEIEAAYAVHNKKLKPQEKTYRSIFNTWFFGSIAFGALAMLAFLISY